MILLTKLDGENILINERHIESVQSAPDAIITLINGKVYAVTQSMEEIIEKLNNFNNKGIIK